MSFHVGDPAGIDSQYLNPAVGMIDGSIRRIESDVTPDEQRAMCTANANDAGPVDAHIIQMDDARKRMLKDLLNRPSLP